MTNVTHSDRRSLLKTAALAAPALALMSAGTTYAAEGDHFYDRLQGGGVIVTSLWQTKAGQADKVAGILERFLPRARAEPGIKLFVISRGKEDPSQFFFFEFFADDAALASHQASDHFKTLIAGEALPLLDKREKALYQPI